MNRLAHHSISPRAALRHAAAALAPRLGRATKAAARAVPVCLLILGCALLMKPALADLPVAVQANGAASGDYIEIGKEYFKNGLIVLGLIIATLGFIAVAAGGIAKFNEYRIGRAELGDLGVLAVVGAVVLVLMVYLLNEAATIIT